MLKNKLVFSDGTEISSGTNKTNAIMWVEETASVNIGEDLVIGSAYANKIKARILTPRGGFSANAGDEVRLVKEENGVTTQCGIYILEKPERTSANSTVITGYDRLIKLDKDLSTWLDGLTGWPYRLIDFAGMVCSACGLTLVTKTVPNAAFPVPKFFRPNVTGRQLMRWLGEICCRFCRANAEGNIEFAWYEESGKTIAPKGEYRYLAGSLSFDTFEVEKVDGVQLRLANSTDGALWPVAQYGIVLAAMNIRKGPGTSYEKAGTLSKGDRVTVLEQTTLSDGITWGRIPQGWARIDNYIELSGPIQNPYIISGNAILFAAITEDMIPYLQTIKEELETFTYTPCKVAIPATLDIRAGHIVNITDINGTTIKTAIMTKVAKGLKNTLESTGNQRRDSTAAVNNRTPAQEAEKALENQSHEDVFNKLTKNGQIQGIYVQDGKWYINAELAQIVNLIAEKLQSIKTRHDMLDPSLTQELSIDGGALSFKINNELLIQIGIDILGHAAVTIDEVKNGKKVVFGNMWGSAISYQGNPDVLGIQNTAELGVDPDTGISYARFDQLNGKNLSWKSNGDGTYSLIGR